MNESVKAVLESIDFKQHKTLNEIVYEAIKKNIIQGKIPSGQKISAQELAVAMNVSRTPVRDALRRLEEEDLVLHYPKIGMIVKHVSVSDAIEVYTIRKALDALAITTAMNKLAPKDFEYLDALLINAEKYNEEDEVNKVIEQFINFKAFIYEKSEMLRTQEVFGKIQDYFSQFREKSFMDKKRRELSIVEYRLVYQAMLEKDAQKITDINNKNLNDSLQLILDKMECETKTN